MAFRVTPRKSDLTGGVLALAVFLSVVVPVAGAVNIVIVSQRNRHFHPDTLIIARGTVVHVINDDRVTHHVYVDSATMKFDSGEQPVGTTVDLEFDHPGTYQVLCAIHPTMHLVVTVK
ncbi:MAG: cupredoxin domain-containing protein [Alphaproteobacteria bacterium]|nr:cupredoxin domain-containing protein [Alphaproteobacteria bacterium]